MGEKGTVRVLPAHQAAILCLLSGARLTKVLCTSQPCATPMASCLPLLVQEALPLFLDYLMGAGSLPVATLAQPSHHPDICPQGSLFGETKVGMNKIREVCIRGG